MKKFLLSLGMFLLSVLLSLPSWVSRGENEVLREQVRDLQNDRKRLLDLFERQAANMGGAALRECWLKDEWWEASEEYDDAFDFVRSSVSSQEEGNRLVRDHNDRVLSTVIECKEKGWECRKDHTVAHTEELRRCDYYRTGILEGPPLCHSPQRRGLLSNSAEKRSLIAGRETVS